MIKSRFFDMGKVVVTKGIGQSMSRNERFALEIILCLRRFAIKDWGSLDEEDKQKNEAALQYPEDFYLLASYLTCKGKIWIITNRISENPGENATTVLFPNER